MKKNVNRILLLSIVYCLCSCSTTSSGPQFEASATVNASKKIKKTRTESDIVNKIMNAIVVPEEYPGDVPQILVYSKSSAYRHKSTATGKLMLTAMADKTGAFDVHFNDSAEYYSTENLRKYDAIVINNATAIEKAFKEPSVRLAIIDFVKKGGGLVGIHAAVDGGYDDWPEYTAMIGGAFDGHPWTANGTWGIKNQDPEHPLVHSLGGEGFMINDELYKLKKYDRSKLRVVLTVDTELSPKGKYQRDDNDHALQWIRNFGKGRVFYSSLGHNNTVYWNEKVLAMWLAGIQFATGSRDMDTRSIALK